MRYQSCFDTGIILTQGDNNSIQLSITPLDNGNAYSAAENYARIAFAKADGNFVYGEAAKSGGTYTYTLLGQEIAAPGKVVADLKLYSTNGRVSSRKFSFFVSPDTITNQSIKSSSYAGVLEEFEAKLKNGGFIGPQGAIGPQGPIGPRGLQGVQGPQGAEGKEGAQGIQGPQGAIGPRGPQGETGQKGETGEPGQRGPQGESGITVPLVPGLFYLSVDPNGTLWIYSTEAIGTPRFVLENGILYYVEE